ncbi:MAG: MOSC N-terminal beta barrel domain-containing protein [Actinomycetota bacterium]|nr:MOSC N-terminal beta barrel domain-containing protein [Actinomycetota bacterium]
MQVDELWRYPVKSLRGEQLAEAELLAGGLFGDRLVYVRAPGGRTITSRTRPGLLRLAGTLGEDGLPLIEDRPWNHPLSIAAVEAVAGVGATLVLSDGPERFDVLPLSILTDGAIAALGVDRRRLRPNILIGGVDGLTERDWPGRELRIGSALVAVVKLRPRCVMTTFDPDTLAQDHGVLRRIVTDFDGVMALDAFVVEPGSVHVGDAVHMLE